MVDFIRSYTYFSNFCRSRFDAIDAFVSPSVEFVHFVERPATLRHISLSSRNFHSRFIYRETRQFPFLFDSSDTHSSGRWQKSKSKCLFACPRIAIPPPWDLWRVIIYWMVTSLWTTYHTQLYQVNQRFFKKVSMELPESKKCWVEKVIEGQTSVWG